MMSSALVIAIVNQKGGVSKTTTARYLADYYASIDKKILLIDFDSQSSLTKGIRGVVTDENNNSTEVEYDTDMFRGESEANIANMFFKKTVSLLPTVNKNILLMPSNRDLSTSDFGRVINKDMVLKSYINKHLKNNFDIIIIDNNPNFDTTTLNSINACDVLVVPVMTGKDEVDGLENFLRNTSEVLEDYEKKIKKTFIIPSRYNDREKVSQYFLEELNNNSLPILEQLSSVLLKGEVMITDPIKERVAFKDSASYKMSVFEFLNENASSSNMKKESREELLNSIKNIAEEIIK